MRVLIVGLPLFAERLKNDLTEFDSTNKYYFLDTYYNKWDRIKVLFMIPRMDVVYSINGTLGDSRVFNLALKLKKKLMITWVGTDVIKAKNLKEVNHLFLNKAEHYCEVDWIQNELLELNIHAKVLNFFNFKEPKKSSFTMNNQLQVLSYISKGREEYYGWNEVLKAAKKLPDVQFTIVGTDIEKNLPENLKCLGWVEDMEAQFENCHCTIRFLEHDGLSGFVLESLFRGKHVIYSEDLDHCLYAKTVDEIIEQLTYLNSQLNQKTLKINSEGIDFVKSNFNSDFILSQLIEEFKR
ncbi:hypothetical protein N9963_00395 [Crocinitomicaceae bacterium]|nr:hypothetical protein [Crocinitomicaceae bacterium]MDB4323840.1 hypothetical protein [Crocinitomicaceae bacterium]